MKGNGLVTEYCTSVLRVTEGSEEVDDEHGDNGDGEDGREILPKENGGDFLFAITMKRTHNG